MGDPHSSIYFGDSRDHWWHDDFVALMARRLDIGRFRRVLDVGCGVGHWARVWMRHLSRGCELVGVDPEERSLSEARRRNESFVTAHELELRIDYRVARAEALPFADGTFDLVTGQTVLIHVADVGRAIAELHRVLVPGGLLLLAEPNNLANEVASLVDRPDLDDAQLLRIFELSLRIERGKQALGEGHNSAGEYLTRWLDRRRFSRVEGWLCDRPSALSPPYDSAQAAADIAELRDFRAKGWHRRPPEVALRFYLAGGGSAAGFEAGWAAALAFDSARIEAIDAGGYAIAGGQVLHLVAAWRSPS